MSGDKTSDFTRRFAELYSDFVYGGGTQQEFAKIIGVSRQTVGAWVNGDRSPKRPTVENIASKFGVSIAWLNGFDVEKEASNAALPSNHNLSGQDTSKVHEFIRMYSALSEENKQLIDRTMKALKAAQERSADSPE